MCKTRDIISAGLLFPAVFLLCQPVNAASTELVSANSNGIRGNQPSLFASISADGRFIAFSSRATNLVPGDSNGKFDIFVRDRLGGTIERVSVDSAEAEANGDSYGRPAISADGRFVAFTSGASNLVPGDANGAEDIFVRDRQAGTTERVSVSTAGIEADLRSDTPTISEDGRWIAFESDAANLAAGTSAGLDVFVRDRQTQTTEWISVGSSALSPPSFRSSISGDGRFVAFVSRDPTSGLIDYFNVFVRDRLLQKTEKVNGGSQPASSLFETAISADGRFIAFNEDGSAMRVRDRKTGAVAEVSINDDGETQNNLVLGLSISADGRFIAFGSSGDNLVPDDTNERFDVFVRDRLTGTTERVSVNSRGGQRQGGSGSPSISANGHFVVFGFDERDIFLRDRGLVSDGNDDLLVDFGANGLWRYQDNRSWEKIDAASPTLIATGDLDGNFRDEAIAAFPGRGLLARYNNAGGWRKLHDLVPVHLVSGDFDGNGIDDLAADFGENALWLRVNNNPWKKLRSGRSKALSVGDLDGNGEDDLIWSSSSVGLLLALVNNSRWETLAVGPTPDRVVTGDLDGNGQDEVVVDFDVVQPWNPGFGGLSVRYNNAGPWVKLSNLPTQGLATGDLGRRDMDELAADFGSSGLWVRYDDGISRKLDTRSPSEILFTDLDRSGKKDLVASFGNGLWVRYHRSSAFRRIRTWPAHAIAAGGFN